MKFEDALRERLEEEMSNLDTMEAGTEEYKATVDTIVKFGDKLIDIQKSENDLEHRLEKEERDSELRRREIEGQKRERWLKYGLGLAGTILTAGVSIFLKKKEIASNEALRKAEMDMFREGFDAAMEFEKDGVITTLAGKQVARKIFK